MTPQELLTKLQGLDGPDASIDWALKWVMNPAYFQPKTLAEIADWAKTTDSTCEPFTASVDAALAFGEELLPGWDWNFEKWTRKGAPSWFRVRLFQDGERVKVEASTLPIAILIAYLKAWVEQQKEKAE